MNDYKSSTNQKNSYVSLTSPPINPFSIKRPHIRDGENNREPTYKKRRPAPLNLNLINNHLSAPCLKSAASLSAKSPYTRICDRYLVLSPRDPKGRFFEESIDENGNSILTKSENQTRNDSDKFWFFYIDSADDMRIDVTENKIKSTNEENIFETLDFTLSSYEDFRKQNENHVQAAATHLDSGYSGIEKTQQNHLSQSYQLDQQCPQQLSGAQVAHQSLPMLQISHQQQPKQQPQSQQSRPQFTTPPQLQTLPLEPHQKQQYHYVSQERPAESQQQDCMPVMLPMTTKILPVTPTTTQNLPFVQDPLYPTPPQPNTEPLHLSQFPNLYTHPHGMATNVNMPPSVVPTPPQALIKQNEKSFPAPLYPASYFPPSRIVPSQASSDVSRDENEDGCGCEDDYYGDYSEEECLATGDASKGTTTEEDEPINAPTAKSKNLTKSSDSLRYQLASIKSKNPEKHKLFVQHMLGSGLSLSSFLEYDIERLIVESKIKKHLFTLREGREMLASLSTKYHQTQNRKKQMEFLMNPEIHKNKCPYARCYYHIIGFAKEAEVYEHVFYVHKNDHYSCDMCSKSYRDKKALERHVQKTHQRENSQDFPPSRQLEFLTKLTMGSSKARASALKDLERLHLASKEKYVSNSIDMPPKSESP